MRSVKNLIGFKIGAIDGEIGKVKDLYVDDTTWTLRYLIVETGSLFFHRKVLISTQSLLPPDWEKRIFLTNLTIDQIENCPDIDLEKSLTREQETGLNKHYSLTDYRSHESGNEKIVVASHLFRTEKIKKYQVNALNGKLGKVEDLLVDKSTWKINSLVIDAFAHPPAKIVLISPASIKEINTETATISINMSEEEIKILPEYNPDKVLTETSVL